ncbi:ABC transporter substrate-binding protein [Chelatococcus sp. SYSU_G07232]|uniref:ABC transporter substrate-binding protein n=1 Tax=Chelatococcus albus TaxID=3047466 RepID=A0ABT7AF00_9HYPH|nr:ABC transporter substrate-binding protein [Chelatococcus sp. SYSU_G07232]MDJ1157928.1 ABC transporter substrate-binding protein [Chelatococcus sp. SYSU_G07232]
MTLGSVRHRHVLFGLALVAALAAAASASAFPVTIDNCGRHITFDRPPSRAVSHDQNISEMMFALGLQPRMVGITGITGWYKMTPRFKAAMGSLPELAPKNPSMEVLIAAEPDFFFAGWSYGMQPGGEVTPDTLAVHGIKTYVLTESCIRVDKMRPRASMDLLYTDIRNLGAIFGKEEEAQALVHGWRERLAKVAEAVKGKPAPRVFLYDSGEEVPLTGGRFAMPTALIEAAGGRNVMDDLETSWGKVSWETVAARNPEFIILLDYQDEAGWKRLWEVLEKHPAMATTDAVKNRRFLPLLYTEITPGPANVGAVEKLAEALHAAGSR